jgi:hypothetical protein
MRSRNAQKRSVFKALPLIDVESRRLHKMGEAAKSGQAPRLKSCDVSALAYLLTTSRVYGGEKGKQRKACLSR